jgi:dihydrofolate reductase
MNFNIIVAQCKNGGIGMDNNLPWKISSDLKKFYKLTKGNNNNAIIMGKNTWNSLNNNPLKWRDNLILSTSLNFEIISDNNYIIKTFNNIDMIINFCKNKNYDNIWVIGGEKIYKLFLDYENIVNNIYLTLIDKDYKCDTFFPNIDNNKFRCIQYKTHILNTNYNKDNEYLDSLIWDKIYKRIN